MTNALGTNEVKVYHRAATGNLTLAQTIATGGGGSGLQLAGVDALGSAGSVQLDPDHRLLFVVNTESALMSYCIAPRPASMNGVNTVAPARDTPRLYSRSPS